MWTTLYNGLTQGFEKAQNYAYDLLEQSGLIHPTPEASTPSPATTVSFQKIAESEPHQTHNSELREEIYTKNVTENTMKSLFSAVNSLRTGLANYGEIANTSLQTVAGKLPLYYNKVTETVLGIPPAIRRSTYPLKDVSEHLTRRIAPLSSVLAYNTLMVNGNRLFNDGHQFRQMLENYQETGEIPQREYFTHLLAEATGAVSFCVSAVLQMSGNAKVRQIVPINETVETLKPIVKRLGVASHLMDIGYAFNFLAGASYVYGYFTDNELMAENQAWLKTNLFLTTSSLDGMVRGFYTWREACAIGKIGGNQLDAIRILQSRLPSEANMIYRKTRQGINSLFILPLAVGTWQDYQLVQQAQNAKQIQVGTFGLVSDFFGWVGLFLRHRLPLLPVAELLTSGQIGLAAIQAYWLTSEESSSKIFDVTIHELLMCAAPYYSTTFIGTFALLPSIHIGAEFAGELTNKLWGQKAQPIGTLLGGVAGLKAGAWAIAEFGAARVTGVLGLLYFIQSARHENLLTDGALPKDGLAMTQLLLRSQHTSLKVLNFERKNNNVEPLQFDDYHDLMLLAGIDLYSHGEEIYFEDLASVQALSASARILEQVGKLSLANKLDEDAKWQLALEISANLNKATITSSGGTSSPALSTESARRLFLIILEPLVFNENFFGKRIWNSQTLAASKKLINDSSVAPLRQALFQFDLETSSLLEFYLKSQNLHSTQEVQQALNEAEKIILYGGLDEQGLRLAAEINQADGLETEKWSNREIMAVWQRLQPFENSTQLLAQIH